MATGANHVIMPAACYNRFSGSVITVFLHCASLRLRSVFLCLNHVARQCRWGIQNGAFIVLVRTWRMSRYSANLEALVLWIFFAQRCVFCCLANACSWVQFVVSYGKMVFCMGTVPASFSCQRMVCNSMATRLPIPTIWCHICAVPAILQSHQWHDRNAYCWWHSSKRFGHEYPTGLVTIWFPPRASSAAVRSVRICWFP